MGESFKKLKKKFLLNAVIKSAIVGVSAGLLVVGALLLALKLSAVELNAGYYVLIGLGVAALTGAPLFFALKPTDKKVAEKLDSELDMNEKVKTMVEFSGKEGDIVALQREDADKKLSAAPKLKPKFAKLWQYVAIPVIACALLCTGFTVPAKTVPDDPVEPPKPFEYDNWKQTALKQLIADVEKSGLEDTVKNPVVVVLNSLYEHLNEVDVEDVMKVAVISSVSLIDEIILNANSFAKIGTELAKFDNLTVFAAALNDGALYFKKESKVITTYAQVVTLSGKAEEQIASQMTASLTNKILADLKSENNGDGAESDGNVSSEAVKLLSQGISLSLTDSGVSEEDALYGYLKNFAGELSNIADMIESGGYSKDALTNTLGTQFVKTENYLTSALYTQSYNCIMNEFIRQRLAEIFEISLAELPLINYGSGNSSGTITPNNPGEDPDKKDEDQSHSGGFGSGNTLLGSDEMFYDPDLDDYVKLSDVIYNRYAEALELIRSGELTEELAKYLDKYYEILFSGIKEDSNDD